MIPVLFEENSSPFRRKLQSCSEKTLVRSEENSFLSRIKLRRDLYVRMYRPARTYVLPDMNVRVGQHIRMCKPTRTIVKMVEFTLFLGHTLKPVINPIRGSAAQRFPSV